MSRTLALLVIGAVLVGTGGRRLAASQQTAPTQQQGITTACHGMQLLMDGDIDGAFQVFRQIEQPEPESPLGYVLEA